MLQRSFIRGWRRWRQLCCRRLLRYAELLQRSSIRERRRRRQLCCHRLFLLVFSCNTKKNKQNKQTRKKRMFTWVPRGSHSSSSLSSPAPTAPAPALALGMLQFHSHNSSSRLAPARRLWSFSDGVRVGGGGRW